MPVRRSSREVSTRDIRQKKKKGGTNWGILDDVAGVAGKIGSDLANAARSAPGGLYQAATAIDQALPPNPIKGLEKFAFEREGKHNDYKAVKGLAGAQWRAIKDLKNPSAWQAHPGDQLLTILGVAPIPGAAVAKAGKLGKAGKASKRKPTRTIIAKPKDLEQAKAWSKARGIDPKNASVNQTFKVEVPAAGPITTRMAQKGLDKARSKSKVMSRRKVEARLAREADLLSRRNNAPSPDFTASMGKLKRGEFYKFKKEKGRNRAWEGVREGNAAIRGARLYRLGYIPPNWLGSRATQYIHGGLKSPQQAKATREMNRGLEAIEPGASRWRDSMMGEGGTQSLVESGLTPDQLPGPIGTFMQGVGTSLGKVTDRTSRRRVFDREAADWGYDTPARQDLLRTSENPKHLKDLIQIADRAEKGAIKFTRSRPLPGRDGTALSRVDRALADNIFLYKWLTGSAQYSGRMLGEHPTLTAMLAAQGQEAPRVDEILGDKVPEFLDSYIPMAKTVGDKFPKVASTRALTLFDSPGEFADTVKQTMKDPVAFVNKLAPVQHALAIGALARDPYFNEVPYGAIDPATGKTRVDPITGRTIRGDTTNLMERLRWVLDQETGSIPYRDLYERLLNGKKGLFPQTKQDAILRHVLGGWFPVPYDPEIGQRMWRDDQPKVSKPRFSRSRSGRKGSSRSSSR